MSEIVGEAHYLNRRLLLSFQDNPYFSAGFGLIGVGAGLAILRQAAHRLLFLVQRRYLTTLEISCKDPSYYWILDWLTKHAYQSGNHFSVQTRLTRKLSAEEAGSMAVSSAQQMNKPGHTAFSLVPSPGVHYLRWKGRWIKVQREREKNSLLDLGSGLPFETITFTTIGKCPQLFMKLLQEARQLAIHQEQGKLAIYTSFAAEWRPFGMPRRKRPLKSVILQDNISERILKDIREFLNSSQWYLERGIPYRRGYLLYGPPGTGKSSFVQALASELDYSICLLNLADGTITDDRLAHLLNALPSQSILLLEDVDAAMPTRQPISPISAVQGQGQGTGRVTLSGLLNALDGVGSAEERIIFLTTNYHERLDPALIRPGRVDLEFYIGKATDAAQVRHMFCRFYPEHPELAEKFSELVTGLELSPAQIQGHFIMHKTCAQDAISNADKLKCL